MRVLLLHNRYRAQGGEERTVGDLAGLLERRGDRVEVLERSSREATRADAARGLLSGGLDPGQVARAVRRLRAEVVHAHNLHPLFGWRALAAARAEGARTVVHLHNFRLFCAIAVAYRDGAPCYRCRRRNTWPGLRLRCRGSLPEAAVYAAGLRRQQPQLMEHADQFVVVSQAHGARLRELGLPAEKTSTLPNFIPSQQFGSGPASGAGQYALISGRLVSEKGYDTAIVAAREAGVPLRVAGEGPDGRRLQALAEGTDVRFLGLLSPHQLAEVRSQAAIVLVPSRCEEACPYAVLDAHAAGIPVLASDRGGLPELVGEGATLPAEDPRAWAQALSRLWQDPGQRRRMGEQALERARREHGEDAYYDRLVEVYGTGGAGIAA
jgi:glycosyltransferase involved in cell wall biosynthesis